MCGVATVQTRALFHVTKSCIRAHSKSHLQCFLYDMLEPWFWRLSHVSTNISKQDQSFISCSFHLHFQASYFELNELHMRVKILRVGNTLYHWRRNHINTVGSRDLCLRGSPSYCWTRGTEFWLNNSLTLSHLTLFQTGRISKPPELGEVPWFEFSYSHVRSQLHCCSETQIG